jgi:hypothetical protein
MERMNRKEIIAHPMEWGRWWRSSKVDERLEN